MTILLRNLSGVLRQVECYTMWTLVHVAFESNKHYMLRALGNYSKM